MNPRRACCCLSLALALALALAAASSASAGQTPAEELAPAGAGLGPARQLLKLKLPPNPRVMVIPVTDEESTRYGMIDPWQAGFVGRRLGEARRDSYDLVILEIDTLGGFIGSCEKIGKEAADCGVPVIAYIRGNAFSGGALIAMGCEVIVMAPGTNLGGAQAVGLLGDLAKDQREKARSLLVARARGLSEKHGFPPNVAQAMVDSEMVLHETDDPRRRFVSEAELEEWRKSTGARGPLPRVIKTWKREGQILTLTAGEAYDTGMAAALAADRASLFATLNVKPAEVVVAGITVTERIGRFLGNPLWLVLLVLVAVIGLVWELKAGGHGLGYLVFLFCMVLFFWLAFLADTAGAAELLLFVLGAGLLAFELFVTPGFGVAGVAGVGCLLVSVALAFVPAGALPSLWKSPGAADPFQEQLLYRGLLWAAVALFSVVVLIVGAVLSGVRLPGISWLALRSDVGAGRLSGKGAAAISPGRNAGILPAPARQAGSLRYGAGGDARGSRAASGAAPPGVAPQLASLVGQLGVAETVLRPSGRVRLGGVSYDATSEGGWIERGKQVKVLEALSTGLRVRQV